MHDRQSHVTPPRRALMESIEDDNGPPQLVDSDDEDDEVDEDGEDEDDEDDDAEDADDDDVDDDDDSGTDRAAISADVAQHPGM
jgi:hypothetical protein